MFAPAAEQNTSIRAKPARPAHMVIMPRKTQRTISSTRSLGPGAEDPTDKNKKKKAGKKKKFDNRQLTLQELWNLPKAIKAKMRVPNTAWARKAKRSETPRLTNADEITG
jgi:hypothetical protein